MPAVADEKGPLPPLPSADDLAAVRGLMSLDMLRATLLERFPDDFGGLVMDGVGFAILTTGRQAEIDAFVEDFSADLMTDHEVAVAPPAFSYATARHSLRSLRDLMADMVADREWLEAEGVLGVGATLGEIREWADIRRASLSDAVDQHAGLRGAAPPGALAQFIVERHVDRRAVGLVTCYNARQDLAWAYIAFTRVSSPTREVDSEMLEGGFLFLGLLFRNWPFRKLYAEIPGWNWEQFSRGAGEFFTLEGVLTDHEYLDGRWWDEHIVAVRREVWTEHAPGLADLYASGSGEPPSVP